MPGRREDEIPEVFAGFRGYRRPRYTPVPSQFLDEHLCFLSGSEVKVLLYIMRHTYGYGKNADHISARQISEGIVTQGGRRIDYGTGLSRSSVWKAIQSLEAKGLVEIIRETGPEGDYEINYYRVREHLGEDDGEEVSGEVPGDTNSDSSSSTTPSEGSSKSEHTLGVVQKSDYPISSANRGSPKIGLPVVQKSDYITIRDSTIRDSLSRDLFDFASRFLEAIGERRPSHQKRERAATVIQELQEQGYAPEEIEAAIDLAAQRGARDAGLLPYIIGEAIALQEATVSPNPQSLSSTSPSDEAASSRLTEGLKRLRNLSEEEYNALRQAALRKLHGRQLPEAAIEGMMVGLLEQRDA